MKVAEFSDTVQILCSASKDDITAVASYENVAAKVKQTWGSLHTRFFGEHRKFQLLIPQFREAENGIDEMLGWLETSEQLIESYNANVIEDLIEAEKRLDDHLLQFSDLTEHQTFIEAKKRDLKLLVDLCGKNINLYNITDKIESQLIQRWEKICSECASWTTRLERNVSCWRRYEGARQTLQDWLHVANRVMEENQPGIEFNTSQSRLTHLQSFFSDLERPTSLFHKYCQYAEELKSEYNDSAPGILEDEIVCVKGDWNTLMESIPAQEILLELEGVDTVLTSQLREAECELRAQTIGQLDTADDIQQLLEQHITFFHEMEFFDDCELKIEALDGINSKASEVPLCAKEVNDRVASLKEQWFKMCEKIKITESKLRSALKESQKYRSTLDKLNLWMDDTERIAKQIDKCKKQQELDKLSTKFETACADQQGYEDTIKWLTSEIENLLADSDENVQYKQKMNLRRCLDRWADVNDLIDITRRRIVLLHDWFDYEAMIEDELTWLDRIWKIISLKYDFDSVAGIAAHIEEYKEHKIEIDGHQNNIERLGKDGEKFLNDDYSPDRTKAMVNRLKMMWEGVLRVYKDNNEAATQMQEDWISVEYSIQQQKEKLKALQEKVSIQLQNKQDLTIVEVKNNIAEAKKLIDQHQDESNKYCTTNDLYIKNVKVYATKGRASEFKDQFEEISESIDNTIADLEKHITKLNYYSDEYDAVDIALGELENWYNGYIQFLIKCNNEETNDDNYDKLKNYYAQATGRFGTLEKITVAIKMLSIEMKVTELEDRLKKFKEIWNKAWSTLNKLLQHNEELRKWKADQERQAKESAKKIPADVPTSFDPTQLPFTGSVYQAVNAEENNDGNGVTINTLAETMMKPFSEKQLNLEKVLGAVNEIWSAILSREFVTKEDVQAAITQGLAEKEQPTVASLTAESHYPTLVVKDNDIDETVISTDPEREKPLENSAANNKKSEQVENTKPLPKGLSALDSDKLPESIEKDSLDSASEEELDVQSSIENLPSKVVNLVNAKDEATMETARPSSNDKISEINSAETSNVVVSKPAEIVAPECAISREVIEEVIEESGKAKNDQERLASMERLAKAILNSVSATNALRQSRQKSPERNTEIYDVIHAATPEANALPIQVEIKDSDNVNTATESNYPGEQDHSEAISDRDTGEEASGTKVPAVDHLDNTEKSSSSDRVTDEKASETQVPAVDRSDDTEKASSFDRVTDEKASETQIPAVDHYDNTEKSSSNDRVTDENESETKVPAVVHFDDTENSNSSDRITDEKASETQVPAVDHYVDMEKTSPSEIQVSAVDHSNDTEKSSSSDRVANKRASGTQVPAVDHYDDTEKSSSSDSVTDEKVSGIQVPAVDDPDDTETSNSSHRVTDKKAPAVDHSDRRKKSGSSNRVTHEKVFGARASTVDRPDDTEKWNSSHKVTDKKAPGTQAPAVDHSDRRKKSGSSNRVTHEKVFGARASTVDRPDDTGKWNSSHRVTDKKAPAVDHADRRKKSGSSNRVTHEKVFGARASTVDRPDDTGKWNSSHRVTDKKAPGTQAPAVDHSDRRTKSGSSNRVTHEKAFGARASTVDRPDDTGKWNSSHRVTDKKAPAVDHSDRRKKSGSSNRVTHEKVFGARASTVDRPDDTEKWNSSHRVTDKKAPGTQAPAVDHSDRRTKSGSSNRVIHEKVFGARASTVDRPDDTEKSNPSRRVTDVKTSKVQVPAVDHSERRKKSGSSDRVTREKVVGARGAAVDRPDDTEKLNPSRRVTDVKTSKVQVPAVDHSDRRKKSGSSDTVFGARVPAVDRPDDTEKSNPSHRVIDKKAPAVDHPDTKKSNPSHRATDVKASKTQVPAVDHSDRRKKSGSSDRVTHEKVLGTRVTALDHPDDTEKSNPSHTVTDVKAPGTQVPAVDHSDRRKRSGSSDRVADEKAFGTRVSAVDHPDDTEKSNPSHTVTDVKAPETEVPAVDHSDRRKRSSSSGRVADEKAFGTRVSAVDHPDDTEKSNPSHTVTDVKAPETQVPAVDHSDRRKRSGSSGRVADEKAFGTRESAVDCPDDTEKSNPSHTVTDVQASEIQVPAVDHSDRREKSGSSGRVVDEKVFGTQVSAVDHPDDTEKSNPSHSVTDIKASGTQEPVVDHYENAEKTGLSYKVTDEKASWTQVPPVDYYDDTEKTGSSDRDTDEKAPETQMPVVGHHDDTEKSSSDDRTSDERVSGIQVPAVDHDNDTKKSSSSDGIPDEGASGTQVHAVDHDDREKSSSNNIDEFYKPSTNKTDAVHTTIEPESINTAETLSSNTADSSDLMSNVIGDNLYQKEELPNENTSKNDSNELGEYRGDEGEINTDLDSTDSQIRRPVMQEELTLDDEKSSSDLAVNRENSTHSSKDDGGSDIGDLSDYLADQVENQSESGYSVEYETSDIESYKAKQRLNVDNEEARDSQLPSTDRNSLSHTDEAGDTTVDDGKESSINDDDSLQASVTTSSAEFELVFQDGQNLSADEEVGSEAYTNESYSPQEAVAISSDMNAGVESDNIDDSQDGVSLSQHSDEELLVTEENNDHDDGSDAEQLVNTDEDGSNADDDYGSTAANRLPDDLVDDEANTSISAIVDANHEKSLRRQENVDAATSHNFVNSDTNCSPNEFVGNEVKMDIAAAEDTNSENSLKVQDNTDGDVELTDESKLHPVENSLPSKAQDAIKNPEISNENIISEQSVVDETAPPKSNDADVIGNELLSPTSSGMAADTNTDQESDDDDIQTIRSILLKESLLHRNDIIELNVREENVRGDSELTEALPDHIADATKIPQNENQPFAFVKDSSSEVPSDHQIQPQNVEQQEHKISLFKFLMRLDPDDKSTAASDTINDDNVQAAACPQVHNLQKATVVTNQSKNKEDQQSVPKHAMKSDGKQQIHSPVSASSNNLNQVVPVDEIYPTNQRQAQNLKNAPIEESEIVLAVAEKPLETKVHDWDRLFKQFDDDAMKTTSNVTNMPSQTIPSADQQSNTSGDLPSVKVAKEMEKSDPPFYKSQLSQPDITIDKSKGFETTLDLKGMKSGAESSSDISVSEKYEYSAKSQSYYDLCGSTSMDDPSVSVEDTILSFMTNITSIVEADCNTMRTDTPPQNALSPDHPAQMDEPNNEIENSDDVEVLQNCSVVADKCLGVLHQTLDCLKEDTDQKHLVTQLEDVNNSLEQHHRDIQKILAEYGLSPKSRKEKAMSTEPISRVQRIDQNLDLIHQRIAYEIGHRRNQERDKTTSENVDFKLDHFCKNFNPKNVKEMKRQLKAFEEEFNVELARRPMKSPSHGSIVSLSLASSEESLLQTKDYESIQDMHKKLDSIFTTWKKFDDSCAAITKWSNQALMQVSQVPATLTRKDAEQEIEKLEKLESLLEEYQDVSESLRVDVQILNDEPLAPNLKNQEEKTRKQLLSLGNIIQQKQSDLKELVNAQPKDYGSNGIKPSESENNAIQDDESTIETTNDTRSKELLQPVTNKIIEFGQKCLSKDKYQSNDTISEKLESVKSNWQELTRKCDEIKEVSGSIKQLRGDIIDKIDWRSRVGSDLSFHMDQYQMNYSEALAMERLEKATELKQQLLIKPTHLEYLKNSLIMMKSVSNDESADSVNDDDCPEEDTKIAYCKWLDYVHKAAGKEAMLEDAVQLLHNFQGSVKELNEVISQEKKTFDTADAESNKDNLISAIDECLQLTSPIEESEEYMKKPKLTNSGILNLSNDDISTGIATTFDGWNELLVDMNKEQDSTNVDDTLINKCRSTLTDTTERVNEAEQLINKCCNDPITSDLSGLQQHLSNLDILHADMLLQQPIIENMSTVTQLLEYKCDSNVVPRIKEDTVEVLARWTTAGSSLIKKKEEICNTIALWKQFQEEEDDVRKWLKSAENDKFTKQNNNENTLDSQLETCEKFLSQVNDYQDRINSFESLANAIKSRVDSYQKYILPVKTEVTNSWSNFCSEITSNWQNLQKVKSYVTQFDETSKIFVSWMKQTEEVMHLVSDPDRSEEEVQKAQMELQSLLSRLDNRQLLLNEINYLAENIFNAEVEAAEIANFAAAVDDINERWVNILCNTTSEYHTVEDFVDNICILEEDVKKWLIFMENIVETLNLGKPMAVVLSTKPDSISIIKHELEKHTLFETEADAHREAIQNLLERKEAVASTSTDNVGDLQQTINILTKSWSKLCATQKDRKVQLELVIEYWMQYQTVKDELSEFVQEIASMCDDEDCTDVKGYAVVKAKYNKYKSMSELLSRNGEKMNIMHGCSQNLIKSCTDNTQQLLQNEDSDLKQKWQELKGHISDKLEELSETYERWNTIKQGSQSIMIMLQRVSTELQRKQTVNSNDNWADYSQRFEKLEMEMNNHRQLYDKTVDAIAFLKSSSFLTDDELTDIAQILHDLTEKWTTTQSMLLVNKGKDDEQHHTWIEFMEKYQTLIGCLNEINLTFSKDLAQAAGPKEQLNIINDTYLPKMDDLEVQKKELIEHAEKLKKIGSKEVCRLIIEKQAMVQERWHDVYHRLINRHAKLTETVKALIKLQTGVKSLLAWLVELEGKLASPRSIQSLQVNELRKSLTDEENIQREVLQKSSSIEAVLDIYRKLLNDPDVCATEEDVRILATTMNDVDNRWKVICKRSNNRVTSAKDAFNFWSKFNDNRQEFENWIHDKNEIVHQLLEMASKDEDDAAVEIETICREIATRKTLLDNLILHYEQIRRSLDDSVSIALKENVNELRKKWINLRKDALAVKRSIQGKLNKALFDQFTENKKGVRNWLANMEERINIMINSSPHSPKQTKDIALKVKRIETSMDEHLSNLSILAEVGRKLIKHCDTEDSINIQQEIDDITLQYEELSSRITDYLDKCNEDMCLPFTQININEGVHHVAAQLSPDAIDLVDADPEGYKLINEDYVDDINQIPPNAPINDRQMMIPPKSESPILQEVYGLEPFVNDMERPSPSRSSSTYPMAEISPDRIQTSRSLTPSPYSNRPHSSMSERYYPTKTVHPKTRTDAIDNRYKGSAIQGREDFAYYQSSYGAAPNYNRHSRHRSATPMPTSSGYYALPEVERPQSSMSARSPTHAVRPTLSSSTSSITDAEKILSYLNGNPTSLNYHRSSVADEDINVSMPLRRDTLPSQDYFRDRAYSGSGSNMAIATVSPERRSDIRELQNTCQELNRKINELETLLDTLKEPYYDSFEVILQNDSKCSRLLETCQSSRQSLNRILQRNERNGLSNQDIDSHLTTSANRIDELTSTFQTCHEKIRKIQEDREKFTQQMKDILCWLDEIELHAMPNRLSVDYPSANIKEQLAQNQRLIRNLESRRSVIFNANSSVHSSLSGFLNKQGKFSEAMTQTITEAKHRWDKLWSITNENQHKLQQILNRCQRVTEVIDEIKRDIGRLEYKLKVEVIDTSLDRNALLNQLSMLKAIKSECADYSQNLAALESSSEYNIASNPETTNNMMDARRQLNMLKKTCSNHILTLEKALIKDDSRLKNQYLANQLAVTNPASSNYRDNLPRSHVGEVTNTNSPRSIALQASNQPAEHSINIGNDLRSGRMTPEVMMTILAKGMEWFSNSRSDRRQ
ncbi:Nesprin-1 [Trichoplax sp. H2]|nr:Nesprin-1 [Trichoplax sp. H2]|eukprot:RDD43120.1 Nesprin-1 [Trichoplax sp. H2]